MKNMYVVCPACEGQALVSSPDFSLRNQDEKDIKLTCSKCGHNKILSEKKKPVLMVSSRNIIRGRYIIIGGTLDPYFHLPLWLTTSCCDNILWAYNYEHLAFLKRHVEAKLRERDTHEMMNKSLGSRLPKWMTSKKNRELVLKSIHQLLRKVEG